MYVCMQTHTCTETKQSPITYIHACMQTHTCTETNRAPSHACRHTHAQRRMHADTHMHRDKQSPIMTWFCCVEYKAWGKR